ncbi:MATE family efflux transporter [Euzebyella saccharophila]|uniref:Membrane protein involved in the export of O-antigen and teichoic acid n=1 Tax=Euzebyella saccharophila TaxID=679664 RepID=A0ABV8JU89_9FLAO|nr:hypothetical protein [Euzebyella saccharophila]
MKIKETSPERLIIGSVLLANGGACLYNLLLGYTMGPESYANRVTLIIFLISLIFGGMIFQLVGSKLDFFVPAKKTSGFVSLPYSCRIGIMAILMVSVLFYSTDLLHHFPSKQMGAVLGIGLAIPLCMVKRIMPGNIYHFLFGKVEGSSKVHTKQLMYLLALSAGYEFIQILIKNGDVLMVSHYFKNQETNQYTALVLVGRVIYILAWVFILKLSIETLRYNQAKKATLPLLRRHLKILGVLLLSIIAICYLFPNTIIGVLFDNDYLAISGLLWQYATVISLFIIATMVTYHFMILKDYIPALFMTVVGLFQMLLFMLFHDSLSIVVQLQIIAMIALLIAQTLYIHTKTMK